MQIYFAGAIRGGRERHDLLARLIAHIRERARVLTEHVGDPELDDQGEAELPDNEIFERDLDWLRASDAVIAEVTTPSLGVGYELGQAEQQGKPTLCLFDLRAGTSLSAMVEGNPALRVEHYRDEEQARALIDEFLDNL